MKFLPFLLANLLRKKVRITMTIGSFTIALFLYCILATIERSFNQGVEVAGADRLVVINKTSIISPLPFSYKERLTQIPNVKHVTYSVWFGGIYQSEKNFFPQLAIDLKTFRGMYTEFKVAPKYWEAFTKDREGCIVGPSTLKRFGWKIGDRVPLRGTIWPGTWEFNICGTYEGTRGDDDLTQFWFRYDYLDERRLPEFGKGTVGWYMVKVDKIEKAAEVLAAIDKRFANSAYETKTDTEKSFASDFVKQIGNIKLIVVIWTTSKEEEDKLFCVEAGAAGYVTKPSNFSELDAAVREILKKWLRINPPRKKKPEERRKAEVGRRNKD